MRDLHGNTDIASMRLASFAFLSGTKISLNPMFNAWDVVGRIPVIGRISPVRPSSPTNIFSSMSCGNVSCSVAWSIPRAMARSNLGPCFLMSAGARLTTTFPLGNVNPEFLMAARTRSRDSWMAVSGRPTMMKAAMEWGWMATSVSTISAERPRSVSVFILIVMF